VTRNLLVFGFVVIGLLAAACGAAGRPDPATSHAASALPAAVISPPAPASASTGCGPFPPRRAWIDDVNSAGNVAWQVRLPTDPTQQGVALRPLAVGGIAIIAEENAVYALRLSDGHRLWKRVFPQVGKGPLSFYSAQVYGLWQYRANVIVLVGQVSSASRLLSLNTATGAVR
jgi:hypothetical protein